MHLKSQQTVAALAFLSASYLVPHPVIKAVFALGYCGVLLFALYSFWRIWCNRPLARAAAVCSLVAFFSIGGSILFYLVDLSWPMRAILAFAAACIPLLCSIATGTPRDDEADEKPRIDVRSKILLAVSGLCALSALLIISVRATLQSSQSPWPHLPPVIFILFFIALASAFLITQRRTFTLPTISLSLIIILALGVVTILYPLGYGFDPAIHQATERLLLETGTIQPKPLFYVGQYALVVMLADISRLPLHALDAYLTLTLAAILLPLVLTVYARAIKSVRLSNLVPLLFFLLPYPFLVQSTPQSLSFLFSFITILLIASRLAHSRVPHVLIAITSLAALAFHPLTGLPLFAIGCLYALHDGLLKERVNRRIRTLFTALVSLGVVLLTPLALLAAGFFSREFNATLRFSLVSLDLPAFATMARRIVKLDDIVYMAYGCVLLLLVAAAGIGLTLAAKKKERGDLFLPWCALLLFVSAGIIGTTVSFDFVAGEQRTYALRLAVLAVLLLYPTIFTGIRWLTERLTRGSDTAVMTWCAILCLGMVCTWYMSYPRFDTIVQSKGFTSSHVDVQSVHWIRAHAAAAPYVVLANQAVSAAAVKEFGFAAYHNGMLYYPLPTNGPLHGLFLAAMDPAQPIAPTINAVRQLTGVQRVYIVLNDYWTNANDIYTNLTNSATEVTRLRTNALFMFE